MIPDAHRHDVATTLHYWADPGDGTPPQAITAGATRVTNERPVVGVRVTVWDVGGDKEDDEKRWRRGGDDDVAGNNNNKKKKKKKKRWVALTRHTLDVQGFQWVRHASAETAFDDDERIATRYFAEAEELLKDV
jgi:hypothetical protein